MRTRLLSIVFLALGGLVSCNSSTEPSTPEPTTRAGSTFIFYREVTDTTWTIPETSDTVIYTMVSIDTAIAGMEHAYFTTSEDDTLVYTIETNGDVKLYQPAVAIPNTELVFPEGWSTLPGVSKTALITDFDIDSLTTIQGQNTRVEFQRFSGYVDESTDTVNGKAITMQTSYIESTVRLTIQSQKFTTRIRAEYSYSPELKTIVGYRHKVWSNHDFSPIPNGGVTRKLVTYKL